MLRHLIIAGLIEFALVYALWRACVNLYASIVRVVGVIENRIRSRPADSVVAFCIFCFAMKARFGFP